MNLVNKWKERISNCVPYISQMTKIMLFYCFSPLVSSPSKKAGDDGNTPQEKSAIQNYLAWERGEALKDDTVILEALPEASWIRCTHADTYFRRDKKVGHISRSCVYEHACSMIMGHPCG